MALELVETAGPAFAMAIARGLVEELLVNQSEERAVAIGLDENGHQGLALGHGAPRPGEHQLLVGDHLAIRAADVMLLAVLGVEGNGVAAAGPHIGLGMPHGPGIGAEPSHDFFGVGPGGVDRFGRGIETTFEGEAWLGFEGGLGGHGSSSTKAASRSSCSCLLYT